MTYFPGPRNRIDPSLDYAQRTREEELRLIKTQEDMDAAERREQEAKEAAYTAEKAVAAARQAEREAEQAERLRAEETNPLVGVIEHILSVLRSTRDFSSNTSNLSAHVRDAERCLTLLKKSR